MADCPGALHLADMADGALARLRVPGGALTSAQARAVAEAADRLGAGVVDLTNRANLQIRGLARDAGPALVAMLEAAGFRFFGEADRRRNVLLDPLAGIDPSEARDLRGLAGALDAALVSAPWIAGLSPKFSFALDGGGTSTVSAIPSDVALRATFDALEIRAAGHAARAFSEETALAAMLALAEAASRLGPDARAIDLPAADLIAALAPTGEATTADPTPAQPLAPRYGFVPAREKSAVVLPVPVGRLDETMMRFLADAADADGDGRLVLAPWSAIVLTGITQDRAASLLARSEAAGFTPVAVAERLSVIACSGAPACERASEPAKALGAAVLRLAAAEPERLPAERRSLHLSACPKGCAGSAPSDLLLLGASDRPGWSLHPGGAPRRPGERLSRIERATPADLLARLAR